jgi:hypothetical protein
VEYLGAMMDAQAAMTIRLLAMNPKATAEYKQIGFEVLWNGVTK